MKIVVDTNVVFSALLNTKSKIGDLILHSDDVFEFYTCEYLKEELKEHQSKIEKISGLNFESIESLKDLVFKNIIFINSEIIPTDFLLESEKTMIDIDIDDTEFFALGKFLNTKIWTGDKNFHNGLLKKYIHQTILTQELWELRNTLRLR